MYKGNSRLEIEDFVSLYGKLDPSPVEVQRTTTVSGTLAQSIGKGMSALKRQGANFSLLIFQISCALLL